MKDNKVAKAAAVYTVSKFSLRAISILTAPIFTRLLTTSDYGMVSNFTAWVSILACFTGLGLGTPVVRGYTKYPYEYDRFVSSVQFLGTVSSMFVLIISLLNLNFVSELMNIEQPLVILLFIYLVFYQSVNYTQTKLRFEYKYKTNVIIAIVSTVASISLSFFFIYKFNDCRYVGRILGPSLSMLFLGLFFYVRIIVKGKCFYNKEYWKYALKLSIPMIPHGLSMIALAQIDRLMIMKYVGSSANGLYSFGYTYATLISILTNALNEAIQPEIYDNLEKNKRISVDLLVNNVNTLITFVAIFFIGVAPEVLRILGPASYYDARWVILPIIIGSFCQFEYQNFACVEIHAENTKYMAIGSIIAAIINYLLNLILIPKYGYVMAGYTTLIGYFWLMIFHFYGAKKSYGVNVFNIRRILIHLLAVMVIGTIFQLLFDFILVRYILITILIIVFYIRNKHKIKKIVKKIMK